MARKTETILGSVAWNANSGITQVTPEIGGQFGYATNPSEWLGAQAYLPRNLIPIVLETPRFFKLMPNPEKWVAAWKLFFEKHAKTIEGLKAGLTVENAEHNFGGAGEMFQEVSDVKRERSTLSVSCVEKYGNVWQNFWEKVIMYGMMHPETKTPLSATLAEGPEDHLADWFTGTIAFIEPDATGKKAMRCWVVVNVGPQSNGPVEGKLDKTSAFSIKELSLEFTALSFYGEGTRVLGQQLLDAIKMTWANPNIRSSFINSVSSDVAAVVKGYQESVTSISESRVGDVI